MRTIGVVGTQPRIGTTTQALQIVQCLRELDYHAAYVEMGAQQYIKKLQDLYTDIQYAGEGLYMYSGLPLHESILGTGRQDYDYLVKDYGSLQDKRYQELSFLEQDVKIVVGGVKANEIDWTEETMKNPKYADVYYIFSFVEQEEQQEIKTMMGAYQQNTYFALYTPNPFRYLHNDAYSYILGE